ncbi:hypothetical protein KAW80_03420 [Candidatus Babeliales bacterium]|nr:hypothetical protein [Candidatus Babeliales bacterium]
MEINITFFIQILNFYVSYRVLNKFIFSPVIQSLEKRKLEEQAILSEIAQNEAKIIDKEHLEKDELIAFQKKIIEQYPLPKTKPPGIKSIIGYKRNAATVKCLTGKIKKIILKEVPRVR